MWYSADRVLTLNALFNFIISNRGAGKTYDANAVQNKVNEKLGVKVKNIDTLAKEVIQGKWGNGQDRKNRLTQAGYDYNAVQKRVNEML